MPRVVVIHRELEEAALLAGRLRDRGVEAAPCRSLGTKCFRQIRAEAPDAILIDLNRAPSYGRALAVLIRENKTINTIPLVFLCGDPAKTAIVRRALPDAAFVLWSDIVPALEKAAATGPRPFQAPRHPNRSVAQKLGITPDSVVALCNPPDGFALDLPQGARIVGKPAGAGVLLFWAFHEAALDRDLPRLATHLEKGRRLWLLWPKRTSGVETSLTMPRVRAIASGHGLIDYKVCAVDDTWSAMAVGRKRQ